MSGPEGGSRRIVACRRSEFWSASGSPPYLVDDVGRRHFFTETHAEESSATNITFPVITVMVSVVGPVRTPRGSIHAV